MTGGLAKLLKRWRDNFYLSQLLAGLAKPLRSVTSQTARQLERKVRKNGVTILLPNSRKLSIGRNSGIGIASLLFWRGLDGFEPETSKTLRFFFERVTAFVDVGANCGLYSILAALWNPNLRVVAFEPVPAIFDGLKRNVRLNRLEDRVRCENLALSDESGNAPLFLPTGDSLDVESTGTLVSDSWQALQGAPCLEVETVRFDDYEARHPCHVDLIKIDVEDFEANVLAGMKRVIKRDRPFIVCEILPRSHGNECTRQVVETLGYHAYWITPAGYVKVPRFDFGRGNYTDFLLSPVSTPDHVLESLQVLWDLQRRLPESNPLEYEQG